MKVSEFVEKLNMINGCLLLNKLFIEEKEQNYFEFINLFVAFFSTMKGDFIEIKSNNMNDIEFVLNNRFDDVFRIEKNLISEESDPAVYIMIDEGWVPYEFGFSTLFLTEYVDWLSNNSDNTFEFEFSGYGIFTPIKKNWDLLFNPLGYPNKLWINNELKTVLLIQNERSTIKCISACLEDMKLVKTIVTSRLVL